MIRNKILSNFDFDVLAAPRTDSAATDSGLGPAALARRFGFSALAELIEQAPRAKFKRERQILPPVEVKQENVIVTIFGENDEGNIKSNLVKVLPTYMVPSEIRVIESFPRMVSMKIDRKALGEMRGQKNIMTKVASTSNPLALRNALEGVAEDLASVFIESEEKVGS